MKLPSSSGALQTVPASETPPSGATPTATEDTTKGCCSSPPQTGNTSAPFARKHKYKVTPHLKKVASGTHSKDSNAFIALNSFDEEVETLIIKAQQMRKTIHPRLLGTSGRELDPGGQPELVPFIDHPC